MWLFELLEIEDLQDAADAEAAEVLALQEVAGPLPPVMDGAGNPAVPLNDDYDDIADDSGSDNEQYVEEIRESDIEDEVDMSVPCCVSADGWWAGCPCNVLCFFLAAGHHYHCQTFNNRGF